MKIIIVVAAAVFLLIVFNIVYYSRREEEREGLYEIREEPPMVYVEPVTQQRSKVVSVDVTPKTESEWLAPYEERYGKFLN